MRKYCHALGLQVTLQFRHMIAKRPPVEELSSFAAEQKLLYQRIVDCISENPHVGAVSNRSVDRDRVSTLGACHELVELDNRVFADDDMYSRFDRRANRELDQR